MASEHFIIKCSCGEVIAQCRCMGPKIETIRPHPACQDARRPEHFGPPKDPAGPLQFAQFRL